MSEPIDNLRSLINDAVRLRMPGAREAKEYFESLVDRYRWRPIAELHEDYGECVLLDITSVAMSVGSSMDTDFDMLEWTHFSQITPLTTEEAERLKAEVGNG